MRDIDVRSALRQQLTLDHLSEPNTLVLDELGLCGQVRVDVAVINGHLAGYEIKSEADTLRRLPTQVSIYSEVLDYAHLVVAGRHHDHALPLIPAWWGVHVAESRSGTVRLTTVRLPRRNREIVPMSLAQLLWRDEALDELALRGADRGVRTKARWHVWVRLADVLTADELRGVVRERLKARQGWRDAPSPRPGGAR